MSKTEPGQAYA